MGKAQRNKQAHQKEAVDVAMFWSNPHNKRMIAKGLALRQLDLHEKFYATELAAILWVLHKHCGYGKKRLLRFVFNYKNIVKELADFYDFDYQSDETPWICAQALKEETGVDVMNLYGEDKIEQR